MINNYHNGKEHYLKKYYKYYKKTNTNKLIKNLKKTRLSRIHLVLNHQKGITNKGQ